MFQQSVNLGGSIARLRIAWQLIKKLRHTTWCRCCVGSSLHFVLNAPSRSWARKRQSCLAEWQGPSGGGALGKQRTLHSFRHSACWRQNLNCARPQPLGSKQTSLCRSQPKLGSCLSRLSRWHRQGDWWQCRRVNKLLPNIAEDEAATSMLVCEVPDLTEEERMDLITHRTGE
jgi:hypothetical protein